MFEAVSQRLVVDDQAEDQVEQVPYVELLRHGPREEDDIVFGAPSQFLHPVSRDGVPMAFVPVRWTMTTTGIVGGEPRRSVEHYTETLLVGAVGDLASPDELSRTVDLPAPGTPVSQMRGTREFCLRGAL